MSYRCQPQFDLKLVDRKEAGHGPRNPRDDGELSSVLINATLKTPFPPVALPKREFMENARALWERFGLPSLTPESPWCGYDLGAWTDELERQARMGASGEHFALGRESERQRRDDVTMNTPIDTSGRRGE
jgi:4-hydroxy-3-polyprenylbenzoate decarboxylase